jgi:thiamine monophosphate synthase
MIFLITNTSLCSENLLLLKIREAALNGVDYILLRENTLDSEVYYQLALSVSQMLSGTKTELIVCHRNDIAKKLNLKCHNRFKERVKETFTVSVHNQEELLMVDKNQYPMFSNVFETSCKPGKKPIDHGDLGHHDNTIALGGINQSTICQLNNAVKHVAVMSEWLFEDDLKALIRSYRLYGY